MARQLIFCWLGGDRGAIFLSVGGGWVAKHFSFCWQRDCREATYLSVGRGLVVVGTDHTNCASQLCIHGLPCRRTPVGGFSWAVAIISCQS